jgi:hypothetical protein
MTQSGDDGRYEAPMERLAGAGVRRARIAAIIVTVVVGSAVGLAILPDPRPAPAPPAPSSRFADTGPTPRPTSNRVETLVDFPDRAIRDAPRPVLVERRGDDARLVRWTPGQGLAPISTIPGAFAGLEGDVLVPVRSPASDRLFVLSNGTGGAAAGHGRLIDTSGTILWERDGLVALPGAVWSPDGTVVVATAQGGQWWIVTIRDGVASGRLVDLSTRAVPGAALPSDQPSPQALVPRTLPLGFSADGRWIYGAFISPQLATITTGFRVSTSGDQTEPVTSFGVGRPDGLAPLPGTIGGRIVDPSSGRIADWRANSDFTGGPPTIEVRDADGAFAFGVDAGTPLGSAWDVDGGLYVLTADTLLFPDLTSLVHVGRDGSLDRPIFETGPVAGSSLLGVWHGFAAIGVTVARPSSASQLVLVDLADPTLTAAITLPAADGGTFIAADLAP